MFATLTLERDPLRWQDLPGYLETWIQVGGGLAAVALAIWFLIRVSRSSRGSGVSWPTWQVVLFWLAFAGAFAGYAFYVFLRSPELLAMMGGEGNTSKPTPIGPPQWQEYCLDVGGACAFFAVGLPLLADLLSGRLSLRRIWALARLSFKEAVRRRVLWAFTGFLVVLLFASWFVPYKEEDQIRNYVHVVYWVMTPLLLATAALLASFSIPTDVRSQTIHTIVTKPVERFEVVLGRFLGFVFLMTLVLVVMTGISLLYVVRTTTGYSPFSFFFPEINTEAEFESLRARVPVYGTLGFRGKDPKFKGLSVGREWEYRQYIGGGTNSTHRAVWSFQELPPDLADRPEPTVPCEFSFDIFRTLKGEEGKGVLCSFGFQTRNWEPGLKSRFERDREQERLKPDADPVAIDNMLAEKYGYFEVANKEVKDYHTQSIDIPKGLFKNALASGGTGTGDRVGEEPWLIQVFVKCETGGQYLGVARYDFYILAHERSFAWNFVKGAAGLWLRLCIVLAVAVTCSTYLSGVVSFVATMFLYLAGFFQEYVRSLAENTAPGGGPFESLIRLVNREAPTSPLDTTPTNSFALGSDDMYRWVLRRVLNLLPDVDRFDWSDYVAEGFNIAGVNLLSLDSLMVVGYLLPWALVAYYLIKSREVATW
jgi:hypothetical protein